jgi:hypothetical protein
MCFQNKEFNVCFVPTLGKMSALFQRWEKCLLCSNVGKNGRGARGLNKAFFGFISALKQT